MPETMLGLDIGDFSIKAVQVAGGLKGYRVVSCTRITIDSKEGLETTLNRLFESIPSNSAGCKTSLHTSQISFRNLTMPFSDRKKISQTIGFELEPLLPFPIDTMTTDYVLSKNADENRVLTASIQEDMLKDYLETLAHHHVDPNVVDIDGVPTATQISLDEKES